MRYPAIDVEPILSYMISRSAVTLVCLLALASACAPGVRAPAHATGSRLPAHIRVRLGDHGPIQSVPLEEYVRTAVLSEVAPEPREVTTGERMLDVQAIIARTYAVAHMARHGLEGYDLCSTTHCQVFDPKRLKTSVWATHAAEASRRTSGLILWYGTHPASAVFHADCGGQTSAARDVWGSDAHPYLAGRPDDGPARTAHTTWRFEVEQARLTAALNRDSRTRVGDRLLSLTVQARDAAGRATAIRLQGSRTVVVRGEDLRAALTRTLGQATLRSTRFQVHRIGSRYRFEGRGYGHGVGLCQAGALARLRAGATPQQVLARYYPGTTLVRMK